MKENIYQNCELEVNFLFTKKTLKRLLILLLKRKQILQGDQSLEIYLFCLKIEMNIPEQRAAIKLFSRKLLSPILLRV